MICRECLHYVLVHTVLHLTNPLRVQDVILVAQNYPLFLWRDNTFTDDDPYLGFLQSMLLVKVRGIPPRMANVDCNLVQALRHIATGPPPEGGYAALSGITRVTIPAIAYSAVMVGALRLLNPHGLPYCRCISPFQAMNTSSTVGEAGISPFASSTSASSRLCLDGQRVTVRHCCCGGTGVW